MLSSIIDVALTLLAREQLNTAAGSCPEQPDPVPAVPCHTRGVHAIRDILIEPKSSPVSFQLT